MAKKKGPSDKLKKLQKEADHFGMELDPNHKRAAKREELDKKIVREVEDARKTQQKRKKTS